MGPFGSNIKVSTFVPEGVPIISGNHLRGYFLEEPEFNYITEEHAERLKNSIVYPHDLIFTHAGNIGQVAMIPDGCKYDRYVLSQRQFYLRCDATKVVPEFLLMFFHSASGQHELLSDGCAINSSTCVKSKKDTVQMSADAGAIEVARAGSSVAG